MIIRITFAGWTFIGAMKYLKNAKRKKTRKHGLDTLPETNSSPLRMDGWNTILSYWVSAYFQG